MSIQIEDNYRPEPKWTSMSSLLQLLNSEYGTDHFMGMQWIYSSYSSVILQTYNNFVLVEEIFMFLLKLYEIKF